MRRSALALILIPFALAARAQDASVAPPQDPAASAPLVGRLEDGRYISPTGTFTVPVPVLPALGGTITDTANVVTFRDAFSTHISIATFPQDATQRWQLSVLGKKDYLEYFISNFVLPDFARAFRGAKLEQSGLFLPNLNEGSFIVYALLPGGSMFANRMPRVSDDGPPPVAKRGNLLFVRDGYIYVISSELAERVTEGASYHQTPGQEDAVLKDRLTDIARRIRFLRPAAPP